MAVFTFGCLQNGKYNEEKNARQEAEREAARRAAIEAALRREAARSADREYLWPAGTRYRSGIEGNGQGWTYR